MNPLLSEQLYHQHTHRTQTDGVLAELQEVKRRRETLKESAADAAKQQAKLAARREKLAAAGDIAPDMLTKIETYTAQLTKEAAGFAASLAECQVQKRALQAVHII